MIMGLFMTTDQKVSGLNPDGVTDNQAVMKVSFIAAFSFAYNLHTT
jgi:hypothetical protein